MTPKERWTPLNPLLHPGFEANDWTVSGITGLPEL